MNDTKLKPCPFCGGEATMKVTQHIPNGLDYTPQCLDPYCCGRITKKWQDRDVAAYAWNRRAPEIVKVETCFYDKEEIYENCTVQVLTNTKTGDVSVGWWKND